MCLSLWLGIVTATPAKVSVEITGIDGALRDNVRAHLSLKDQAELPSEIHLRRLYRKAETEIRNALKALGYYDPIIDGELLTEPVWNARFDIAPGQPVRVRALDLRLIYAEGERDETFDRLVDAYPLKTGDVLNHGIYERAKRNWQAMAAERGYFDARIVASKVTVDLAAQSADIALHYDLGRRYRFGLVSFSLDDYDLGYLRRYVPFEVGEPYVADKLQKLRTALEGSDHFSSVDVTALREEAEDGLIPIVVELGARSRYKLSTGLGYGTDTGPRLRLGWDKRRVNRRGHSLATELSVSTLSNSLSASYRIPLADPLRESLEIQSGWKNERTDTSDSNALSLGVRRSLVRGGSWRETQYLTLLHDRFDVGDVSDTSLLVLPGITWSRTRSRDKLYPRWGDRLSLDVRGTDRVFGSSTSFLQTTLKGKYIRGLGERGRLLLRSDIGFSLVGDFDALPPAQRYFAGGDYSVRGYSYQSLGPKDDNGDVIGGKYLVVGSLEYDHRIGDKWGVAAFYDVGNALDDFSGELMHGVGIGVRWRTPVGPIRVDIARALSEDGHPFRLHFTIGPDL